MTDTRICAGRWISSTIGVFSLVVVSALGAQTSADSARTDSAQQATRQQRAKLVDSRKGLVVSVHELASDAGASILAKGGNAVDAAVATAFALAVVHPAAGNLGGGGFMLIRPASGRPTAIDYREQAPLSASKTMYLDSTGKVVRNWTATGYLAPGVPGTVRGLGLAHQKYGKLPWRDVVMPAVTLAEKGFALSASLASSLNSEITRMASYPASVKAYGKPGGGRWAAGDTIVLRDLGRTLRTIATQGADAFYTGWIADSIAAAMRANRGMITKLDLAKYRPHERTPVTGTYRGYGIISMPPVSSGGVTIIETLNILENFDLKSGGWDNARTQHYIIEAMRRGYLDRARWLGDPDFVKMPIDRLTSKAYAKELAAGIDATRATSSIELGKDIVTQPEKYESMETTHFSVVDKDGMAVSNTYTLEGSFGSHVVPSGTGVILNNEMGDFNKAPGLTDSTGTIGTDANLIAPGKRMLSSMTPTIVTKDGQLFLVTGSPGSRAIIGTVLSMILRTVDFGMNVQDAVFAPRIDHQWLPDVVNYERGGGLSESVMNELKATGHNVRATRANQGDAHSIMFDAKTKTAWGANDTRVGTSSKVSKGW